MAQVPHQVSAYPGFCSMKQLGIFLLPPGRDAGPIHWYPFIHQCEERHCKRKVSCPIKQDTGRRQNMDPWSIDWVHQNTAWVHRPPVFTTPGAV